mgnify:CR=1 FL=1|jgi:HAD superfamily hydrolase (TIGR01509 family)
MYKAALFDLDGTLTDSMNLSAQAFICTLRQHLQQEFTPEGIFAMFGPAEEEIFQHLDPEQAPDMMQTFLEFYRSRHQEYAQVYPGVIPMLTRLKEKMPLAVITGKGEKPALITIGELGLDGYFQHIITGSCVKRHKPDPEGILKVLDSLAVKPEQAFYLGDSPGDIESARGAGVTALAALWGASNQERLLKQKPDWSFANPEEFLAWIENMCPLP